MIDAKQPLIYFANNSDFEAQYDNTAANDYRNKQAVFVGDTHMIYTHGVAFNGNDTIYNDSELRGLISDAEYDDTEIKGQISTLEGLVSGVQSDLEGLHDWSQEDIDARIQALISDAEWMRDNFPNEIISQSNFGEDDVEEYLQRIGVITIDEETGQPVVTWSTFQQSYDSLESRVDQLEQNGPDIEGLETRLHQYINEDTAIADLTSKWFWSHDDDIEWALAGLKTAANNAESFASVWSAMDQKVNGLDDTVHGTAGLVTKVSNIEDNFVAKTELATLVENAGFATTAGTVAKSDLDGSVAALFSQASSTNSAVDSKLAGVITSSNLDSAISTMLASNGIGAAAVSTYVNNQWSGVTISADDIYLDGQTWAQYINALGVTANSLHTGNTTENYSYTTDISGDTIQLRWWMTKNGIDHDNSVFISGGNPSTNNNYGLIGIGKDLDHLSVKIDDSGIICPNVTSANVDSTNIDSETLAASRWIYLGDTTSEQYAEPSDGEIVITNSEDPVEALTISYNNGIDYNTDKVLNIGSSGIQTTSIKTRTIASSTVDTPINVTDALSFSGNTIVSDTGIVTPTLNVGENTINSNGISLSNKDITGARNIAAKNISLTTEYDGGDVEETSIVPGTIIIYDTESDGSIAFDSGRAYFGMAPNQNTLIAISNNASVEIDGINSVVTANDFEQSSDRNLKDIVSDTTLTVEQIAEAPAVNFTWKKDSGKEDKKQNVGTIAQYWQVVLPEVTGEAKDGSLTLQYGNAAMVSAIVTAKEVVALKEEIAELKRQIAELKAN